MKIFSIHKLNISIPIAFLFFINSCQKQEINEPANIFIEHIDFEEIDHHQELILQNGVGYQPDNPDFHWQIPSTWTGNMAQYVKHTYTYSITYSVKNTRSGIAYDTEIDLFQNYSNGDEVISTFKLGEVNPGREITKTVEVSSTDKRLLECQAEAYWYH